MKATAVKLGLAAGVFALACGCNREERPLGALPSAGEPPQTSQPGNPEVRAGGFAPLPDYGGSPDSLKQAEGNVASYRLQGNSYTMAEGQTLFATMNCVGCHANGGGDKGPSLIDNKWTYGSSLTEVYDSIASGRPHGMPAYRGRLPDSSLWQLATYVRSMSGLSSKVAAPGRQDHMQAVRPPNSTPRPESIETVPTRPPATSEAPR